MFRIKHNFIGLRNMKSFATIFFSVFYLSLSAGLSINVHLCTSILVSSENTDCSKNGCCSKGETQSCCTEKTYVLQLDNSEQICHNNRDFQNLTLDQNAELGFCIDPIVVNKSRPQLLTLSRSNQSTPLYTLYCSHLHYGWSLYLVYKDLSIVNQPFIFHIKYS